MLDGGVRAAEAWCARAGKLFGALEVAIGAELCWKGGSLMTFLREIG
jgi:hypothetical protein